MNWTGIEDREEVTETKCQLAERLFENLCVE